MRITDNLEIQVMELSEVNTDKMELHVVLKVQYFGTRLPRYFALHAWCCPTNAAFSDSKVAYKYRAGLKSGP